MIGQLERNTRGELLSDLLRWPGPAIPYRQIRWIKNRQSSSLERSLSRWSSVKPFVRR